MAIVYQIHLIAHSLLELLKLHAPLPMLPFVATLSIGVRMPHQMSVSLALYRIHLSLWVDALLYMHLSNP